MLGCLGQTWGGLNGFSAMSTNSVPSVIESRAN